MSDISIPNVAESKTNEFKTTESKTSADSTKTRLEKKIKQYELHNLEYLILFFLLFQKPDYTHIHIILENQFHQIYVNL